MAVTRVDPKPRCPPNCRQPQENFGPGPVRNERTFYNPTQLADFGTATFTDCDVTNSKVANQQVDLGSVNGLTVYKVNMTDTFRVQASAGKPSPGEIPWAV